MAHKPLFNKCKIKVIDDYAGITRPDEDDSLQKGILVDFDLMPDHLTTSTGYYVEYQKDYQDALESCKGKTVYWEQYGEAGNVIEEDGEKFAYIPFYRLIAVED